MIKQLTKLANHLDSKGLRKEADYLDSMIRSAARVILADETNEPVYNPGGPGDVKLTISPEGDVESYTPAASKNTDANYILVTNKITAKIWELAYGQNSGEPREGAFTYEIYKGQSGNYYQFNIVDNELHRRALTAALKQSTDIQREATKIVREHLNLDESGRYGSYSGTNNHHSWKLAQ